MAVCIAEEDIEERGDYGRADVVIKREIRLLSEHKKGAFFRYRLAGGQEVQKLLQQLPIHLIIVIWRTYDMNKKKLKTLNGWVRINPIPKFSSNVDVPDLWFVDKVTDDHIRLSYPTTGHTKDIGLDHFTEYRTDSFVDKGRESNGILMLKTQIIVTGKSVILEPLTRPPISPKKNRNGNCLLLN
ncbi:MAG: hypothetical protein VST71_04510 [Nitrospirota bacterium]|nr:hypothetical protein [Nitrospirota bacterium]